MTTGVFKAINVIGANGRPIIDAETGRPVSQTVEMTQEELDALNADRSALVQETKFPALVFLDRFTEAEQLAIVTQSYTDAPIKLGYDRMFASREVMVSDPRVMSWMTALVAAGVITRERATEILGIPLT